MQKIGSQIEVPDEMLINRGWGPFKKKELDDHIRHRFARDIAEKLAESEIDNAIVERPKDGFSPFGKTQYRVELCVINRDEYAELMRIKKMYHELYNSLSHFKTKI